VENKLETVGNVFGVVVKLITPFAMLTNGLTWIGRFFYDIFNYGYVIVATIFHVIKSPFELFYAAFLWPVVSIFRLLKWVVETIVIGMPMTLIRYIVNFISSGGVAFLNGFSLIGKTIAAWIYTLKNVIFPAV